MRHHNGWEQLDDSAALHRSALYRTANQLSKLANNPNAEPSRAARCRNWAEGLWWLHGATGDDADPPTGGARHLDHLLEWRIHWEASIDLPQIQAKRDRVCRLDQDLRAVDWALQTLGLETAAA